jgi:hypothetical protein
VEWRRRCTLCGARRLHASLTAPPQQRRRRACTPHPPPLPCPPPAPRVFRSRLLEASRRGAASISFLAIAGHLSRGEAAKAFYQVCGALRGAG